MHITSNDKKLDSRRSGVRLKTAKSARAGDEDEKVSFKFNSQKKKNITGEGRTFHENDQEQSQRTQS